jgi:hypothetical protein
MADKNPNIPSGVEHLKMLDVAALYTLRAGEPSFKAKEEGNLEFIGVCLNVLYQAATCHRGCHGGAHVFESLSGRAYNLAAAAIHLSKIGFYDEALNLVRGVGEIANLVLLCGFDPEALKEWLATDDKTRRNKFSPAAVRKLLSKSVNLPLIADEDWYSSMCEKYTHVSPKTKPNFHNVERPICGGLFQEKGLDEVLGRLAAVLGHLSLGICRSFNFNDLFDEISEMLIGDDEEGATQEN